MDNEQSYLAVWTNFCRDNKLVVNQPLLKCYIDMYGLRFCNCLGDRLFKDSAEGEDILKKLYDEWISFGEIERPKHQELTESDLILKAKNLDFFKCCEKSRKRWNKDVDVMYFKGLLGDAGGDNLDEKVDELLDAKNIDKYIQDTKDRLKTARKLFDEHLKAYAVFTVSEVVVESLKTMIVNKGYQGCKNLAVALEIQVGVEYNKSYKIFKEYYEAVMAYCAISSKNRPDDLILDEEKEVGAEEAVKALKSLVPPIETSNPDILIYDEEVTRPTAVVDSQRCKHIAIEECGELIQAICKDLREKTNRDNIIEEIVDVSIALEWLHNIYNIKSDEYNKVLKFKKDRINKSLEEGTFK